MLLIIRYHNHDYISIMNVNYLIIFLNKLSVTEYYDIIIEPHIVFIIYYNKMRKGYSIWTINPSEKKE